MPVRGGEDVELADEATGERKAGEAEHERPHRDSEQRPLPAEAGQVLERHGNAELALARCDDGERTERGRGVGNEVEQERPRAERGVRGHRDQHEAGV